MAAKYQHTVQLPADLEAFRLDRKAQGESFNGLVNRVLRQEMEFRLLRLDSGKEE